jgi:hypothetical protein
MAGNEKCLFEIEAVDERTGQSRSLEEIAVDLLCQQPATKKLLAAWIATTGDAYDEARRRIRVRDAIAEEAAYA